MLGAGVLGLLTAMLLQRSGRRLCVEPVAWRRELTGSLDITAVAAEETGQQKVPLVIDASGNLEAPAQALGLLDHEGTLLIASWFGSQPVPLPLGGAFHRRRRAEVAALLPELPLGELCTHVFLFARAADLFRAVDENAPALMHAVPDYGQGGQPGRAREHR